MSALARRMAMRAPRRGIGAAAGFTLIELMVVLVVIALLSAAVMLTMADPRGGLSGEVDRLAGRIRAARDSAIVSGHSVALWVSPTGYGFERRADGRWQPIVDGPLAATDWARGAQAVIASGDRLRVTFDTVGRADQPLAFTLQRGAAHIALRMDLDGMVTSHD